MPMLSMPKADGDAGFLNPAFVMQTTADPDEANMQVDHVKAARDSSVQLPVLKNTGPLKTGDSLMLSEARSPWHPQPWRSVPSGGEPRRAPMHETCMICS